MSDASQFYTGLVADLYAPLKSMSQNAKPYAAFLRTRGEPALELGCGDGEPLLDLVEMGFDVEGLDSSMDMLDRCAAAAAARGLDVVLHHGSMAEVALSRRYRSIFIAGATFNLLPDDEVALASLVRIREHLADDGAAFIPLFIPPPTPPEVLGRFRETASDDGATLRFAPIRETRATTRRAPRRRCFVTNGWSTARPRRWNDRGCCTGTPRKGSPPWLRRRAWSWSPRSTTQANRRRPTPRRLL